jgi:hypothetical protein
MPAYARCLKVWQVPDANFTIYPSIAGKTVLITGGGSGIGAPAIPPLGTIFIR